ncbi:MAG: hypothetical protein AB1752_14515 [Candidatus Zixiibacteriota bacterium]
MNPEAQQPAPIPRQSLPLWIIAIAALLALHIRALWFICDDAFISFRYARSLVFGHGLVFNIGERVEGYTNFLWVLISAAVIRLGAQPEVWMPWLGAAIAILNLAAIMWHLSRRGRSPLLAGALLATNCGYAAWATGGLETALFTALVTGAFLSLWDSIDTGGSGRDNSNAVIRSAPLLALACLTRPDGALIAICAAAFLFARVMRSRLTFKSFLIWLAIWAIPLAGHLGWRLWYYGHPFPNSFYVKTSTWDMIPTGAQYLLDSFLAFHWYLLLIPLVYVLVRHRTIRATHTASQLAMVIAVPWLVYVCLVGGDFMDMFRFVVPVAPLILIGVAEYWQSMHTDLAARFSRRIAMAASVVLVVAMAVLNGYSTWQARQESYHHERDSIGLLRTYADNWRRIADQIAQVSVPTDTLATTAAGIIPYYTGVHTIDQLGLVAPDLSQYHPRPNARPGHTLLLDGAAMRKMLPQFIVGHPSIADRADTARMALFLEKEWFDRIVMHYRPATITLSESPPVYTSYLIRNDLAEGRLPAPSR